MTPSPISRRKSIAVPHHATAFRPTHKRRPHSITPGDSVLKQLSPAARRRRSLAPRKSILKAAITPDDTIAPEDATQSMDFTRDFGDLQDNTTRKSLGRRVSFAPAAYVRVFDKNKKDKRRSSAYSDGSPEDSGAKDENASNKTRRRSSMRRSIAFSENGEASMEIDSDFDDTGPLPEGFMDGSDLQDEEFDDNLGDLPEDDGEDMELTEAMPVRRKSVSFGSRRRSSIQHRAPLSQVSHDPSDEHESMHIDDSVSMDDHTQSTDMTQSSNASSGDHSQTMDFTVPVHRPFRKSEPPSEQWLALRAMTHSGNTPYEEPPSEEEDDGDLGLYPDGGSVSMAASEDMELTVAQSRLIALRDSLGLGQATQEDSFTSSENASLDFSNDEMGGQTVNVMNILRQSLSGADMSAMDFTEIHHQPEHTSEDDVSEDPISPPQPSPKQAEVEPAGPQISAPQPASSVFSAPPPQAPQQNAPQPPPPGRVFFRPGTQPAPPKPNPPSSPANPNPSPRKAGTAAFAPPTARPQPKRPAPPDPQEQENRRSPVERTSVAARASLAAAGRLSPRKGSAEPAPAHANGGLLRRPSGYFAQRKSLGPSGFSNAATEPQAGPSKATVATGRASIGSVAELSSVFERPMSPIAAQRQLREASPAHARASPRRDEVATQLEDPQGPSQEEVHEEDMEVEHDVPEGDAGPTEQWRAGVQQQSFSDDDGPPISIEQFFAMTGIRFMDEIAAPRRSTIHPSQLQSLRRSSVPEADIPLADYMIAMTVDVPQLEQYSRVVKDLQSWIENSKEIYRQAEEEAAKFTPTLFREYSMADEEVQEELLHQLKLIKANNHGNARSQWYDWRLQWVEGLYEIADSGFSDLEKDARSLESTIAQTQSILPSLREEHARVMKELEEEQSIANEIEHCDQDYLNELNSTIAEQESTLEAYRVDISETNVQLERLHEKLEEIEAQKRETSAAIGESKHLIHIQKTSTRAEVFRLKDELAALEELHLWRNTTVRPDLFEFVYASRYQVTVPCNEYRPILDKIEITRTKDMALKFKDQFPRLTDVSLKLAQQRLAASPHSLGVTEVIENLGDLWSSCAQLRTQFKLLAIRYPLALEIITAPDGAVSGLKAVVTAMLHTVKGKIFITFTWDSDTLADWPMSIRSLAFDVRVAYGSVDAGSIREALVRRLTQSTPTDNHACILDACAEATYDYEES
ncbi:hypothetical protein DENSPDRAFT_814750 [Dentipellis sp. KUC8613]|nr:hypothetical protein DENSPDRAFT_814750 [Dentipellis sp. KUC8613]